MAESQYENLLASLIAVNDLSRFGAGPGVLIRFIRHAILPLK